MEIKFGTNKEGRHAFQIVIGAREDMLFIAHLLKPSAINNAAFEATKAAVANGAKLAMREYDSVVAGFANHNAKMQNLNLSEIPQLAALGRMSDEEREAVMAGLDNQAPVDKDLVCALDEIERDFLEKMKCNVINDVDENDDDMNTTLQSLEAKWKEALDNTTGATKVQRKQMVVDILNELTDKTNVSPRDPIVMILTAVSKAKAFAAIDQMDVPND